MPTLRRLLEYLRPYKGTWTISFTLALLAMVATVASPWLVGRAIDKIRAGDQGGVELIAVAIALLGLGRALLTVGRRLVSGRVSLAVEQDLRNLLYTHLQRLDMSFFDRWQTGQLMSRATVDLSAVRFFLGYGIVFIVQAFLTVVLAAIAMFVLQPTLAVVALAPAPLMFFVGLSYGKRGRPAQQAAQQAAAELTAAAEESITGIRVVKAFAAEDRRRAAFEAAVEESFAKRLHAVRIESQFQPVVQFLPLISLALVLLVGGRMVIGKSISVGEFTAFYVYVLMLVQPLRSLGVILGLAQRAIASGIRLFEIIDREPLIVSPAHPQTLPAAGSGPVGSISFSNVTLVYDGQSRPALKNVDLEIKAGERVAIVGETGSGKTALIQLLPRLYDPTEGYLRIDGVDVTQLELGDLRSQLAIVDDNPFLFTDTIARNIAYARPAASMEEIQAAARAAKADDFIQKLGDGYDTVVGERGLTLSGGQRQRLAIARALLARPRILVLDDATSSLDASTEQAIASELDLLMRERTTLVIAHRLSTVHLADRVVVMKAGTVAETGTHAQLMESSALYRSVVAYGPEEAAA